MATRPGDWGALRLGADPTPGDVAALTTIADAMRALAADAGTVNNGLKALQQTAGDGRRFIGRTADQLRGMVDDHLHNFVGHVEESFHQAEAALRTYATALAQAQSDADQALAAVHGLDHDDPRRQTHIDRADDAKTTLAHAARTLDRTLTEAGSLMVMPVSDCELFWEAFKWLTIVLTVIGIFTGGALAILAWGMNAVMLIKAIVDFSQGKAKGLELGLAFLGVLFPTTRALPVGAIIKGLGGVLKGSVQGISQAGKNISAEIGRFSALYGVPKTAVAPLVVAVHTLNGVKGVGSLAKGGWGSLAGAVSKDWVKFTGQVDGAWGKFGAYGKITAGRAGRIGIVTFLPLDYAELSVLGLAGAARLAFGERVLGIKYPELHALLAHAGRTEAALRGGADVGGGTGTFDGNGALVPFRPVGAPGTPTPTRPVGGPVPDVVVPGGSVDLSRLRFPAGGVQGVHVTPGGLPGMTARPSGLTVPDVHGSGATRLIQQVDFEAGHIRLDNNLLLPAHTAIDLLKDAHVSAPTAHAVTDVPTVRVPEPSSGAGSVHGIGDGQAMARGAIGHGEALEDMSFPELQALASGDVAVTSFHGEGISVRIGDAAARTFTAQDLAHTAPGGTARTDLTGGLDVKIPVGSPATGGAHAPLRAEIPDQAPGTRAGVPSGAGSTTKAAPRPALDQHDVAMSLLESGGREPVRATGRSAAMDRGGSGVSARQDLDGAGASGTVDHSALDLIAHPGGSPAKAADTAVPAAVRTTGHPPTPTSVPAPPGNRFAGAAAMNQRLRARDDLILGGSTGPEAGAKLNAWAAYENALSQLGKAERKVGELVRPGADRGEPSPALAEALDDLGAKRAEAAGAAAKLDELGVDAARTRQQINALTGGIFGEHAVGGGPPPHPRPETRAIPPVDKGKAKADSVEPEPEPAPRSLLPRHPAPKDRLGFGPDDALGARSRATDRIVTGGTAGWEARLRLDAWDQYERASYGLAGARGELDRVPKADQPGSSTASAKALAALDRLSAKRAEFTDAKARLDELGMDPQTIQQQIDDAYAAIAVECWKRGRPVPGPGGAPFHHPKARDAEMTGPAHHGDHHQMPGLRWEPDLTSHTTPGDIHVNTAFTDAFQRLGKSDQWSLSDEQYLTNLCHSVDEQRPISYVVNTVVRYDDIRFDDIGTVKRMGGQQTDTSLTSIPDFLKAVTTGLPDGYRGRFGVVIGINGPKEELGKINEAVRRALDDVHADFPIAVVGIGWHTGKFPYGTIRNTVMTSPASRSMVHAMMAGGDGVPPSHPYFAFMDFDRYPHTVPGGQHVFDYFEKKFEMRGVERAGEPSETAPLRPLMMTGGYRVPEPPGPGEPDLLLAETNARLADGAKGRVTKDHRPDLALRIRADMRARAGHAGLHPLLPYPPEPNLFVDATATLVDRIPGSEGWLPLRFGPMESEANHLCDALNKFNAWELDSTLSRLSHGDFRQRPGAIVDREAQREIAAGNHTLPVRGTAFVAEFEEAAIATDVSRMVAGLFGKRKKLP
ncbi:hypothetical protein AB0L85_28045 [Streptomyces sp. NPDC052051]|uniref:hypothetical protein n=1 Tax=Streptomyces sp. NPDC052051 TaxID=3154649 RepID=UPI0034185D9A